MDQGWEVWPDSRGRTRGQAERLQRDRFYYDTVTFTDRNLRFMLDVLGSERVVFGTDRPAPMQVYGSDQSDCGTSEVLEESERADLLWRTAASIFNGCGHDVERPKVFVVQPIMDVGRRALAEIADVVVHESERMIDRAAAPRRRPRLRLHLDARRYADRWSR